MSARIGPGLAAVAGHTVHLFPFRFVHTFSFFCVRLFVFSFLIHLWHLFLLSNATTKGNETWIFER